MDPRRLSAGEWVAAVGAVLLLVALFLPWYSAAGHNATGWEALSVDDILLGLIAVGTLFALVATASTRRAAVPVSYTALSCLAGFVAFILAAWRLADPAPAGDVMRESGPYLALAGACAVTIGAWLGIRDEGPARRSEAATRAAAAAAKERAELVALPPDVGGAA